MPSNIDGMLLDKYHQAHIHSCSVVDRSDLLTCQYALTTTVLEIGWIYSMVVAERL